MNFFFYTAECYESGCKIRDMVRKEFSNKEVTLVSSIKDFTSFHLGLRVRNNDLVMIALHCPDELHELLTLHSLLEDMHLVLLVPELEPPLLAKAHLLRPRFLHIGEVNLQHLAAILHKILDCEPGHFPPSQYVTQ